MFRELGMLTREKHTSRSKDRDVSANFILGAVHEDATFKLFELGST